MRFDGVTLKPTHVVRQHMYLAHTLKGAMFGTSRQIRKQSCSQQEVESSRIFPQRYIKRNVSIPVHIDCVSSCKCNLFCSLIVEGGAICFIVRTPLVMFGEMFKNQIDMAFLKRQGTIQVYSFTIHITHIFIFLSIVFQFFCPLCALTMQISN